MKRVGDIHDPGGGVLLLPRQFRCFELSTSEIDPIPFLPALTRGQRRRVIHLVGVEPPEKQYAQLCGGLEMVFQKILFIIFPKLLLPPIPKMLG